MEPECSLPHSKVPATCPYPEPARPSPYPTTYFLKIYLNIFLPSTPGSPRWSLSHKYLHKNPVDASPLQKTLYKPCPSHSYRFITRTILSDEYRSFYEGLKYDLKITIIIIINTGYLPFWCSRCCRLIQFSFEDH